MKQQSKNRNYIPVRDGRFVMRDYDTDNDLRRAKADIERFLICLSQGSLYDIMRFLAPYRQKAGRESQAEYDDLTEFVNDEQANKES